MKRQTFLAVLIFLLCADARAGALQRFSTADLRGAIADARPNSRVYIPAGVYELGDRGIRIEDKRNVTIVGAGEGRTILRAGPSAPFILELAGSNYNLTVSNMSLEGASHLSRNTHALASGSDRMNLAGARFHDLDIRNVAVGISVVGSGNGYCSDIQITNNHLENIQEVVKPDGTTSGSGYGIHNDGCSNVVIAENVIRNADRHSIYQASAYQPDRPRGSGSIVIERNLIVDNAKTSSLNNDWLVALVVARSSNVTVANNEIVNPYHDAISIEDPPQEGRSYTVKNVRLIGNTVRGGRGADVFLTAAGSFVASGNRFFHGTSSRASPAFVRRDGRGVSGRLTDDGSD